MDVADPVATGTSLRDRARAWMEDDRTTRPARSCAA